MGKHTPETLKAVGCHIVVRDGLRLSFVLRDETTSDELKAIAARIEASYNACAGIPTEQLEAGCLQAMRDAFCGHESPQLWRVEWLAGLLNSYHTGGLDLIAAEAAEDPNAFADLIDELHDLVRLSRDALAPFQKESDQ